MAHQLFFFSYYMNTKLFMEALIGASHLSIEQNTQLLIYNGFVLPLLPSQPAVKLTVRLSSDGRVFSSVFHGMAAVASQMMQHS